MSDTSKIAVIGLGYVGLPLAVEFAKTFQVTGFDIKTERVEELKLGIDSTGEVQKESLENDQLTFSSHLDDLKNHDYFIVTVPTPINERNEPDLMPLIRASEMIAPYIESGNVIVYESTVYPGVTETVCKKMLETTSGLKEGTDFFLGYSPERINPGDKEHTLKSIVKIVSANDDDIADKLVELYGQLNDGKIFKAKDIKTAEAAKVIENAQRDINIAFINEVTMIFSKMGISIYDVLETAGTKWNFLPFTPGLVGGHCIGVDPYYLSYAAETMKYHPKVILSGRDINEEMSHFCARRCLGYFQECQIDRDDPILILGFTFKENIPDLRNTKIIEFYNDLVKAGFKPDIHDSYADPKEALSLYGVNLMSEFPKDKYAAIILAVPHQDYVAFDNLNQILTPDGLIFDIKGAWRNHDNKKHFHYRTL